MIQSVADNDVLYKGTRYGLLLPMLAAMRSSGGLGILGAARYIVRKKLAKRPPKRGVDVAASEFEDALKHLAVLEPSMEEVQVASFLEHTAQALGVELDSGESQLCAIVLSRKLRLLVTGDKRAIVAIHSLIESGEAAIAGLRCRLACLEQVFLAMLTPESVADVRRLVCTEPDVDRALCICFACSSSIASEAGVREGLLSYVEALRHQAPHALASAV